jgi:hypothetical protein
VDLTLEKVAYHKDMWNEKHCSHEGLSTVSMTFNRDHLTKDESKKREFVVLGQEISEGNAKAFEQTAHGNIFYYSIQHYF